MVAILDDNLACLEQHRPELYERISQIEIDREHYRRVMARSGVPNLEVAKKQGLPIALHSRHDPQRESERAVEPIGKTSVTVPLFFGMGLGYDIYAAWTRYRDRYFDMLIVERDPQIFLAALETIPFSSLLSDMRVHWVIGDDLPGLKSALKRVLPGIMSSSFTIIESRGSVQLASDYYRDVAEILKGTLRQTTTEFNYMARYGPQLQYNVWKNLPAMLGQPGLRLAKGLWKNRPGILVGAGPSLNKNLALLADVRDRVLIVCVDTAYRVLASHGIHPHIVIASDPTELEANHFQGLDFAAVPPGESPILAFDPEVFPAVTQLVPWRKLILNLEKSITTRWFDEKAGPWGLYDKGGSVAQAGWMILEMLDANPVILMGMDLAFPREGGATHASGTALPRKLGPVGEGTQKALLGPHAATQEPLEENIVWVPGVDGGKVPTSQIMALYIRTLQECFSATSRRVIDATEGGAYIPGTKLMTLADALTTTASADEGNFRTPQSALALLRPQTPQEGYADFADAIEQMAAELVTHAEESESALNDSAALETELRRGPGIYDLPQWIEMEDRFRALYKNPTVKIALEQALFSATYYFSQKEDPSQTGIRLKKYQTYFKTLTELAYQFIPVLESVAASIRQIN